MRLRRSSSGPFNIVVRGYDRSQVESYLRQNQSWTTHAWNRIQHLEARVAELEDVCSTSERDRKEASELAEQARVTLLESKETAAEIVHAAEVRAANILDTAARGIKKAQEEVDRSNREVDSDEAGAADRGKHAGSEGVVKATRTNARPQTAELADRLRLLRSPLSLPPAPNDGPATDE
jgi:hypothetical protein